MSRAILFTMAAAALAVPAFARQQTGFLDRSVTVDGKARKYVVYVPENWSKAQRWPVILFLHGAGERGDDGLKQSQVGIGGAIRFHRERFPAIVVMPQCATGAWWTQPEMEKVALAALKAASKEFRGDASRTYLTGLSMGGYGTFAIGARNPGKFAALAAICGGVVLPRRPNLPQTPVPAGDPYEATAKGIGKTPIWIFHGDADPTVPVEESRKMKQALEAQGATPKYTEYPKVGHNSWDKAYGEEEFAKWLLEQRLR